MSKSTASSTRRGRRLGGALAVDNCMFGNPTYIIWLALFLALPLLALIAVARRVLWRRRRALALALGGALLGGWAWDVLIVRLGAWHYDPHFIAGVWIAGLPVEEWIWIVGVTLLFGGLTVVLEEQRAENKEQRTENKEQRRPAA